MTSRIYAFLGHKMRLIADGDALTGCRWLLPGEGSDEVEGTERGKEVIELAIRQIEEYLEGRRKVFTIPLRPVGTEFRIRVWREIGKIPYGESITYKELARRVGSPGGFRAVANACGANPFPILIPCHRVVGSDGKLGGYTGGVEIKRALLELESGGVEAGVVVEESAD